MKDEEFMKLRVSSCRPK